MSKIFDLDGNKQQPPQQLNLSVEDIMNAPDIECSECGHNIFIPAYRFKRINKLLIGEREDKNLPMQTLACVKCGAEMGEGSTVKDNSDTIKNEDNKANDEPDTAFD